MKKKHIVAIGLSASVVLLAAAAAGILYYSLMKSLPTMEGEASAQGISTPVSVYRDDVGVPHILAHNEDDAYFALGFVHAQDRLWQMDLMRRIGQGRLAEVFGSTALPYDKQMRTLGLARAVDSLYPYLSSDAKRITEAYSRGVNACIADMNGHYPIEFDVLRYSPELWKPEHSLLVMRVMAWDLALSWWVDLILGDLIQTVGTEKAMFAFPGYPVSAPVVWESGEERRERRPARRDSSASALQPFPSREVRELLSETLAMRAFLGQDGSAIGSNSWVVTRQKSVNGSPVLANDPHMVHAQPARWYLVHIACPTFQAAGASVPGVPGIAIGHNRRIAWGMTNLMADDVDFYVESVRFKDSTYEYKGGRLPLRVRVDSIFVRDSLPVALTVYETLHGPIITRVYTPDIQHQRFRRPAAIAVRWTGYGRSDEIGALYNVNRAASWSDFTQALSTFGVPGQNFTYADRNGTIGLQSAGRIPIRSELSAMLPNAGYNAVGEWEGYVPYDRLPRIVNPPSDAIACANNKLARSFPFYVSNLWQSENRITRVFDLLNEQPSFTANDFRLMQQDMTSPGEARVRDAFVRAMIRKPNRTLDETRAMNVLAAWDLRFSASSSAAALYSAAFCRLAEGTFRDEMGDPLYRSYVYVSSIPQRVLPALLGDTAAVGWFDNVKTPAVETEDDILQKSFSEALDELSRKLGPDIDAWRWGELHTATFRHPLGDRKPLDAIFNVGPFPVSGSNTTINNSEFRFDKPYEAVVTPTLRMIVDLAAIDSCAIILPTGQSGQPLSRHYADQAGLWLHGSYHILVTDVDRIRASDWKRLTLTPRR